MGISTNFFPVFRYFRGEFTQSHVSSDKFDKEYVYGIRSEFKVFLISIIKPNQFIALRISTDLVTFGDAYCVPWWRLFDLLNYLCEETNLIDS